jgi:hypothetical protein
VEADLELRLRGAARCVGQQPLEASEPFQAGISGKEERNGVTLSRYGNKKKQ